MGPRVTIAVAVVAIGLAGYAAWRAVSHDGEPETYDRAAAEREKKAKGPKVKLPPVKPPKKAVPPDPGPGEPKPTRVTKPSPKSPVPPPKSESELAEEADAAADALERFDSAIAQLKELEDLADSGAQPVFDQARQALRELDENTNFSDDQARRRLLTATETMARYEKKLSQALRG